MSSSGIGCPSLNRRGKRISNRRNVLLVFGWALDGERDALRRQKRQGGLRDEQFAGGPSLERKAPRQKAQGSALGFSIRETHQNHDSHSSRCRERLQSNRPSRFVIQSDAAGKG